MIQPIAEKHKIQLWTLVYLNNVYWKFELEQFFSGFYVHTHLSVVKLNIVLSINAAYLENTNTVVFCQTFHEKKNGRNWI